MKQRLVSAALSLAVIQLMGCQINIPNATVSGNNLNANANVNANVNAGGSPAPAASASPGTKPSAAPSAKPTPKATAAPVGNVALATHEEADFTVGLPEGWPIAPKAEAKGAVLPRLRTELRQAKALAARISVSNVLVPIELAAAQKKAETPADSQTKLKVLESKAYELDGAEAVFVKKTYAVPSGQVLTTIEVVAKQYGGTYALNLTWQTNTKLDAAMDEVLASWKWSGTAPDFLAGAAPTPAPSAEPTPEPGSTVGEGATVVLEPHEGVTEHGVYFTPGVYTMTAKMAEETNLVFWLYDENGEYVDMPFNEIGPGEWKYVFEVEQAGTFYLVQEAAGSYWTITIAQAAAGTEVPTSDVDPADLTEEDDEADEAEDELADDELDEDEVVDDEEDEGV